MIAQSQFGSGDSTLNAVGGAEKVRSLVDAFYDLMTLNPDYDVIRNMHPADLTLSRDKLATFLVGWMGGPRHYKEKFGPLSIPGVHKHLPITASERDEWLACMKEALDLQAFPQDLTEYLITQLGHPADLIRRTCERAQATISPEV